MKCPKCGKINEDNHLLMIDGNVKAGGCRICYMEVVDQFLDGNGLHTCPICSLPHKDNNSIIDEFGDIIEYVCSDCLDDRLEIEYNENNR